MLEEDRGFSERLLRYAYSLRYDEIPGQVLTRAKLLFKDFLACALGGQSAADSSGPITAGIAELNAGAAGRCTVIGSGTTYPPHLAALLNGAYGHTMDFDDFNREALIHPGTTVFPTLLALGEHANAPGRDFLTACIIGYDALGKIGKVHGEAVHRRGFHPTATTGIFGCTLAGARLFGLSIGQARNALGLNVSQAAGAQQFNENGAWDKRLHTGLAAHNAILSLFMARHGYLGSIRPLEGKLGYFALFAGLQDNRRAVLGDLGIRFEVMNTAVKPYPCCRCSHSSIDAIIAFSRQKELTPHTIAAIELTIDPYSYELVANPPVAKRHISSIVEAQFSLPFVAAAATKGEFTWKSYELIADPAIRELMQRLAVVPDKNIPQYGAKIRLMLRDGGEMKKEIMLPSGEPESFPAPAAIDQKLTEWAAPVIGSEATQYLLRRIETLESMPNISVLTHLLRTVSP